MAFFKKILLDVNINSPLSMCSVNLPDSFCPRVREDSEIGVFESTYFVMYHFYLDYEIPKWKNARKFTSLSNR